MPEYPAPDYPYAGPAAHYGSRTNMPINRVVIHGTVTPCKVGYAAIIARYFRTTDRYASTQYVGDPGTMLQVVWDSYVAYGAPPNENTLHIEICDTVTGPLSRWLDRPHRRALKRAARLTAEACLAYDVPIKKIGPKALRAGARGICGHVDVSKAWGQTNHWDPGAFPWRRFIRLVNAEARKIKGVRAVRLRNALASLTAAIDLLAAMPESRKRVHVLEDDLRLQAEALQALIDQIEGGSE